MPRASRDDLPVERIDAYEGRMTQMGDYNLAFESMPANFPPHELFAGTRSPMHVWNAGSSPEVGRVRMLQLAPCDAHSRGDPRAHRGVPCQPRSHTPKSSRPQWCKAFASYPDLIVPVCRPRSRLRSEVQRWTGLIRDTEAELEFHVLVVLRKSVSVEKYDWLGSAELKSHQCVPGTA